MAHLDVYILSIMFQNKANNMLTSNTKAKAEVPSIHPWEFLKMFTPYRVFMKNKETKSSDDKEDIY